MPAHQTDLFSLTPEHVDLVFPLAREADRRLSLDGWRDFAAPRAVADPSERRLPGVLLASRNKHIRGLAAYDVADDGGFERVLIANNVVIVDRSRERHLVLDLLGGLLRIAKAARCSRVCAELPPSSRWIQTRWSDPGGRVFRLPVECETLPSSGDEETIAPATDILNFRPRGYDPYTNATS